MKLCTTVQEGCGYKDTLRASLLCSVSKIFHCVHYLSATPRRINLALCSRMCQNLHKKIELEIYDGEEESFNAEFITNNILVKGVSVQYRITK